MKLQEWIESEERDYGIGLAILGTHCKNRILLQNLGRKKNPEKLEYELGKVAQLQGIVIGKVEETETDGHEEKFPPIEETGGKEQTSKKTINPDDLPPVLKAMWHQNQDSYKEIRALHEKLKLMENATPEERQPLTERIAILDDTIRANWAEIDAYVPGSEKVPSAVIDHKRMQANRKYISTNLKKLPEVIDQVKAAKIVAELQNRFNQIKASGETFAQDTIDELTKVGVEC